MGAPTRGDLRLSPDGALLFRYDKDARATDRLSASLPFEPGRDLPGTFFSNLLPDGVLRERLAAKLGVSASNEFAMLAAVGGDCAGALSLLPVDQEPSTEAGKVPLTRALLRKALDGGSPAFGAEQGLRLSLAGAQDKLAVVLEGNRLYLPQGATSSTHILKLPNPRFRGLAENELLTSHLARRVGLGCTTSRLWPVQSNETDQGLLVTRFDRLGGRRVHQEDMCQALGLPPSRKYEAEGGPTLAEVLRIVMTETTTPALEVEKLVRWQVFNLLVGNCDGHAKNLALLRSTEGVTLAPFYDLVCTRQWPALSKRLALSIGGSDDPGDIGLKHWHRAAREWGLSPSLLESVVDEVVRGLKSELAGLEEIARSLGLESNQARTLQTAILKLVRHTERLLTPPRPGAGRR